LIVLAVIASGWSFALVTAPFWILEVETAPAWSFALATAPFWILEVETAPAWSFAFVTAPSFSCTAPTLFLGKLNAA
jgi:hypothetical protein